VNNKNILPLYIFLLLSSLLYSQTEKDKVYLSKILANLSEKHQYSFTYAHDVVKNILINPPSPNLNLKKSVDYLELKTGLIFKFIENNIITISTPNESFFICGYLIDSETKIPLESATISSRNDHVVSDSFGYFRLKVNSSNNALVIRHLGYQPFAKLASSFEKNSCSNIFMNTSIEMFSEVILSDYIVKGIYKLADGTFSINFSDFGILPGLIETDVLQTVQALPGIQSANETVSDINIRGGTHDQNLVLWDGIKMYQSGHFFGLISIFNPLITTDVTIVKNGTSVDLTDGVSGTIAMKTDSKINNKVSGSFGANFINADAFVDTPIGHNSSIQISARKSISDLLEKPTYAEYFKRILQDSEFENNTTEVINSDVKFDFYDTSMRWLYGISEKDQLRINFLNISNELVFNENAFINQTEESKKSSLQQNSIAGSLFYRRSWSDKFITTFQISESGYKLKSINADILKQRRVLQENDVTETSVKLNNHYQINKELSVFGGYHFTEVIVRNLTDVDNPVVIQSIKEVIREHATFVQINYLSNSKNTSIRAGVRHNYIEKFKKHIIEPRFSLNHKLADHFSVELLGEIKHQNSSQIINFQNDFLGVEKRRWILSNNKDIPIIKSHQGSVGLNYDYSGWLISAEGYYKKVKGITSQSQGFLNQYILERVNGDYYVKGIDFLINKKIKKLGIWLSYSYADNEYNFKGLSVVNFPNNLDINHAISFGSSFSTNNFKVSTGFNWHTGKPSTAPIVGNEITNNMINYQEPNSSRLSEYLRIDASATYSFNISNKIKAITGISIWNGFNHKNIISNYYSIDGSLIKEESKRALEFTPNFSFRILF
jgi:hypothetical protein